MLHSIILTLKYSIFGLIIVPSIVAFAVGFIVAGVSALNSKGQSS